MLIYDWFFSCGYYWVHFDFLYRKDVYNLETHVRGRQEILFASELPVQDMIRKDPVFENNIVIPEYLKAENRLLLEQLFKKLLFNFRDHKMFWQLECKILLLQVIKIVVEQVAGSMRQIDLRSEKSILSLAIEYISKNYFRKLMLKDISKAIGFNKDYLGRVFKKESGMTMTQYISRLRLAKAKELLAHSDLNLTDVAEMVGFSDLFYFSKIVKSLKGYLHPALKIC